MLNLRMASISIRPMSTNQLAVLKKKGEFYEVLVRRPGMGYG